MIFMIEILVPMSNLYKDILLTNESILTINTLFWHAMESDKLFGSLPKQQQTSQDRLVFLSMILLKCKRLFMK